jgi:hypothetical protein
MIDIITTATAWFAGFLAKTDICDDCLLKIFKSLGVEKEGSILKDWD